jgi:hypothetical protein
MAPCSLTKKIKRVAVYRPIFIAHIRKSCRFAMQALFSGYDRGYEWECNLVESQAVGVESGKELELTTRQEALYLCLWLACAAQIHA